MRRWQFYTTLFLGLLCVGLSVALVIAAYRNQRMQSELQARQARINSGILGPEAQQVVANVVQEMGMIATTNASMRALLEKHGYLRQSPPAESSPAVGNEAREEPVEGEG